MRSAEVSYVYIIALRIWRKNRIVCAAAAGIIRHFFMLDSHASRVWRKFLRISSDHLLPMDGYNASSLALKVHRAFSSALDRLTAYFKAYSYGSQHQFKTNARQGQYRPAFPKAATSYISSISRSSGFSAENPFLL